MHVGFRRSFFSYRVFDPDVVSGFQIIGEEFWKPYGESRVRHVGGRTEGNAFFEEKRIDRAGAFDRADAFVAIQ